MFATFGRDLARIRVESLRADGRPRSAKSPGRMRRALGLTRLELGLSLVGPFVLLGAAGSLGGLAAIVLLLAALGGLGIAAAAFGTDSRDGADW